MRTTLMLLAVLCVTSVKAETNVELLQPILGKHLLKTWQMESGYAGVLEIYSSDSSVGWRTIAPTDTPKLVPELNVAVALASAVIYQADKVIVIEDSAAARRVSIQLELADGIITMDTTICTETGCESYVAEAVQNKSSSEVIDSKTFFEARNGSYKILKAGGAAITKEETFDVDAVNDPAEVGIYAPYCEPGTNICDLGYISLPWASTKVFQIGGENSFEIVVGEGAAQKRYQWTESLGSPILFRNYQYTLPSSQKNVVLDHEVEKIAR